MISYPDVDVVLDGLGDKVQHGLGRAVALTREDLDEYRQSLPKLVLRHGPRGLANWIQDQLWFHATSRFDGLAEVLVYERGVTREIVVDGTYRLRIKRHHLTGAVSTFATQTALEFLDQPTGQLPGLEEVNLIAGYEWDKDEARIVRPVLSLRDGLDNIIWLVELPEDPAAGAVVVNLPDVDGPTPPVVEVRSTPDERGQVEEES